MSVRFSFPLSMGFCKARAAFILPEPLKARDFLSFWAKKNEFARTLSAQPTNICWSAGCSTCYSSKESRFKLQLIRTEYFFPVTSPLFCVLCLISAPCTEFDLVFTGMETVGPSPAWKLMQDYIFSWIWMRVRCLARRWDPKCSWSNM